MTTVREFVQEAADKGVSSADISAAFSRRYGVGIETVDPDQDLSAIASAAASRAAPPAPGEPSETDGGFMGFAKDVTRFRDQSLMDSARDVTRFAQKPRALPKALSGAASALVESAVMPTVLAPQIDLQTRALERLTEEERALLTTSGAGSSEEEQASIISQARAGTLSAEDREQFLSRQQQASSISSAARKRQDKILEVADPLVKRAKEVPSVKGHLDEEAEFAKRMKDSTAVERTIQDAGEIVSAIPQMFATLGGFTDADPFTSGEELVGGMIGGTSAVFMNPVEAFEAKPLTFLSTIAGPLARLGKAAKTNPKVAKFIEENPKLNKLVSTVNSFKRAIGETEIPLLQDTVRKKVIDIGEKGSKPTKVHRTTRDMESLRVDHVLSSAAKGATAGMLIGMPGLGAATAVSGRLGASVIRKNPKLAEALAGASRFLSDTSAQSSALREQRVRQALVQAPRAVGGLSAATDKLAKRVQEGEIGRDTAVLVDTPVIRPSKDVTTSGSVTAETAQAQRMMAPVEGMLAGAGMDLPASSRRSLERTKKSLAETAAEKVIRAEDQGLPVPSLGEASAKIFADMNEILSEDAGLAPEFVAKYMRQIVDASAGGHTLLKSDRVRSIMEDIILEGVDKDTAARLRPIVREELFQASQNPFRYVDILKEVDEATAGLGDGPMTERVLVAAIPENISINGIERIDAGKVLAQALDGMDQTSIAEIQGQVMRGILEENINTIGHAAQQAEMNRVAPKGMSAGTFALRTLKRSILHGEPPPQWLPEGVGGSEMGHATRTIAEAPVTLDGLRSLRDEFGEGVRTVSDEAVKEKASLKKQMDEEVKPHLESGDTAAITEIRAKYSDAMTEVDKSADSATNRMSEDIAAIDKTIARFADVEGRMSVGQAVLETSLGRPMTRAELATFKEHSRQVADEFNSYVSPGVVEMPVVQRDGSVKIESLTYDQLIERQSAAVDSRFAEAAQKAIDGMQVRAKKMGLDNPSSMDRFMSPGMASTMAWHNKYALQQMGVWGKVSSMIKSGLTVANPSTHINNFTANAGLQSIRRGVGPLSLIKEVARDSADYLKYKKDPLSVSAADRMLFEIVDESGLIDTDIIGNEVNGAAAAGFLGDIEQRTPEGAKKVVRGIQWYNDKAGKTYRWGDQGYKINEAKRAASDLIDATERLEVGDTITIPTSPNARTIIKKGIGRDGQPALFRDGKQLSNKQFKRIIAARARMRATNLFFDYSQVPGFLRVLRNAGPASIVAPFLTWAWKAMDAPGKKGLISHTLFDDALFETTNSALAKDRAVANAYAGVRRLAIIQAAATQMHDNKPFLEEISKFRGSDTGRALFAATSNPNVMNTRSLQGIDIFEPGIRVLRGLAAAGAKALNASDSMNSEEDKRLLRLLKSDRLFTTGDAMRIAGTAGSPLLEIFETLNNDNKDRFGNPVSNTKIMNQILSMTIGQLPTKVIDVALAMGGSDLSTFNLGRQKSPELRDDFARWSVRRILGLGWSKMALAGDLGRVDRFIKDKEKLILAPMNAEIARLETAATVGDGESVKERLATVKRLASIVAEESKLVHEEVGEKWRLLMGKKRTK